MPVQAPRRLFTVDEFRQMAEIGIFGEDDRVELLAGEIVEMTPIGQRHAGCVNDLNRVFSDALGSRVIVSVQNPIRLGEHSEPQPDLALLRFRADFYRDAHPGPADVLLVVEVAETSAATERADKVPLYGRAGVREAWVIDLGSSLVDVYRQPSPEGYLGIHQHAVRAGSIAAA
jgi:Uma2 family endonuclease